MRDFLLCLLTGSFGAIVGFYVANWARKLPAPLCDHSECQVRFERMNFALRRQIHDKEAEIQRLLQGLS